MIIREVGSLQSLANHGLTNRRIAIERLKWFGCKFDD